MPSDSTLDQLRREIDSVDREILKLVATRVRLVLSIGEYKREHQLAVYDAERERQMLDQLAQQARAPLSGETVRRVFERLIDESRRVEQHHVAKPSRA